MCISYGAHGQTYPLPLTEPSGYGKMGCTGPAVREEPPTRGHQASSGKACGSPEISRDILYTPCALGLRPGAVAALNTGAETIVIHSERKPPRYP